MTSSISRCRGCGAASLEPVFSLDPMPLAGAFRRSAEEARSLPRYPLTWVACLRCSLVQVAEEIPDEELYGAYHYASSSVPPLVEHFERYAAFLARRYGAGSRVRFLEIGCNDGVLLRRLPPGWELAGVDPSDVARNAPGGYALVPARFTPALVEEQGWTGAMDVVSGSNCLAHIRDLAEVFRASALALRPGGELWIEVHDLEALLQGAQWDTIYHEHRAEWSAASLRACLGAAGMEMAEMEQLALHGGLLRCCFRKGRAPVPPRAAFGHARGMERLRSAYAGRYQCAAVRELMRSGEPAAAYGASGRASVFLNQLPDLPVAWVADDAPLRCGRHVPGRGLPVVPSRRLEEEPRPASVLITAWNYRQAIQARHPGFAGRWLAAFPYEAPCASA